MGRRDFGNRREGESPYDDRKSDRDESSGAKTKTARMANHRYGVEADLDELRQIQRIERTYGVRRLKRWLGEGMPYEAMGNPHTMDRFRERKGTPVPWDVEAENEESLHRSQRAIQRGPRSGETGVPDAVRDVISSPGKSLDPSIQRAMEERMGDSFGVLASEAREGSKGERSESFGDVQIHTGPQAAEACDSINARAFTVGNHVAFDRGEYDPGSPEGQHVLAHELAHVRQQTGGRLLMLPQDDLALEIDPDPELEREAEETAKRVMAGGELGIQRLGRSKVHVQRFGGVITAGIEMFQSLKQVRETNDEIRQQIQEHQREKFNSLGGQGDGDLESRVAHLEEAVGHIGGHLAQQVGDGTGDAGQIGGAMVHEGIKSSIATAAGWAVGGPIGAIATSILAAGGLEYVKTNLPEIAPTIDQVIGGEGDQDTNAGEDPFSGGNQ